MQVIQNSRIYLRIPYEDKDRAKRIVGYQFHPGTKQWSFPLSLRNLVCKMFPDQAGQINNDLQEMHEKHADHMAAKRAQYRSIDLNMYAFKVQPYEHQVKMIKMGMVFEKLAYLCEMGTGKTMVITILTVIRAVPTLIICPTTVMENWIKEYHKFTDLKPILLYGTSKKRIQLLKDGMTGTKPPVFIINYEGLLVLNKYTHSRLLLKQFKQVVLDESSKIKSPKAKRSKTIVKLFSETPFKYILSGTPVTQGPLDIYMQYQFLDPAFLGGGSFYAFRNYYAVMGGYGGYEIQGYKHIDELEQKISAHAIQIKKEDCLDLPDKVYEKREIEMSPEQRQQYNSMRDDMILELQDQENITAGIILTKLLRLQQISSGAYLEKGKNAKLDELEQVLDETSGKHKIIWCRFRDTMKLIERLLQARGTSYCTMHGDTTNRQEIIDDFQEGKYEVFLGQINTGGMGITITRATYTIYYENTFSLEDRLQSEDRNHRAGQTNKVTYIDLVYKGSIDQHILASISKKQDISHQLVACFKGGQF